MKTFIAAIAIIVSSGCGGADNMSPVERRKDGVVTGRGSAIYAETVEVNGRTYDVFHTDDCRGGVHAVLVDPKE